MYTFDDLIVLTASQSSNLWFICSPRSAWTKSNCPPNSTSSIFTPKRWWVYPSIYKSWPISIIKDHFQTPQNDSTPATSTVTPTPVAVKSSVPAQKSSITGRTHPDSGVVSPCGEAGSSTPVPRMAPTVPGQTKTRSNSTDGGLGGSLCGEEEAETGSTEEGQALSDSGQGSETDEQSANHVVSYHFHVPNWLCGELSGSFWFWDKDEWLSW